MEEMLSARQFAIKTGRPPRTVQAWVDRKEVRDVQKVGTSWAAPRSAWEEAAQKERKVGRPKNAEKPAPPE